MKYFPIKNDNYINIFDDKRRTNIFRLIKINKNDINNKKIYPSILTKIKYILFLFFISIFLDTVILKINGRKNLTVFIEDIKINKNLDGRNNLTNLNKEIIEAEIYEKFDNIKNRYNNDSFLKPYLDNITLLSHLYHKKIKYFKENKNNIHICVSLNDKYVYPILVGITMALINCNINNTFITYHILCAPDVTNTTLSILKSLIYKYYSNLEMIFYDMNNSFMNKRHIYFSQAAFYRILTPIFIDFEKIIYLDGDAIILKDLNEMYQLKFNDNYILGFLDVISNGVDFLGIKSEKYINDGIILLNLEKIRNDNKIYDLINFSNGNINLPKDEQTVINYVFYPKIGLLPTKFGIWNFSHKKDIKIFVSYLRTKYDIKELEESFLNPSIIHNDLCWPKMWIKTSQYNEKLTTCKKRGNCFCEKYHNLWYYYAKKTDYYENITKYFNN